MRSRLAFETRSPRTASTSSTARAMPSASAAASPSALPSAQPSAQPCLKIQFCTATSFGHEATPAQLPIALIRPLFEELRRLLARDALLQPAVEHDRIGASKDALPVALFDSEP